MCHTDIAFRLICAGDVADHTVIARFRQAHEAAFAELFTQVLALCREAGPARLCMVAIDGSKVAADAPEQANRGEQRLDTEAEKTDRAAEQHRTEQAVSPPRVRVRDRRWITACALPRARRSTSGVAPRSSRFRGRTGAAT